MRKAVKILIWLAIAAWFVVVIGFINSEVEEIICNHVDITMMDSTGNRFISLSEVRTILEESEMGIQGYPMAGINTRELEGKLEKDPYIKNAEVYCDISGKLSINIYQREPLIRIMPDNRRGYYIDHDGYLLPLSDTYSALIMLASGEIDSPDDMLNRGSLLNFSEEQKAEYASLLDLYRFSKYLSKHPFWSSQIVQIYLNRKGEYELIPRVGAHQILLGEMDNFNMKLKNLEALYRQGMPIYGWNRYDKIDLKYSNQVICTKR